MLGKNRISRTKRSRWEDSTRLYPQQLFGSPTQTLSVFISISSRLSAADNFWNCHSIANPPASTRNNSLTLRLFDTNTFLNFLSRTEWILELSHSHSLCDMLDFFFDFCRGVFAVWSVLFALGFAFVKLNPDDDIPTSAEIAKNISIFMLCPSFVINVVHRYLLNVINNI